MADFTPIKETNMSLNRRELLFKLALAGLVPWPLLDEINFAAADAGPLRNLKSEANCPMILTFQMPGSWDVCLAWDPKDREEKDPQGNKIFDQPYAIADLETLQGITLGPAAESLKKYAAEMTIINGIDMGANQEHNLDTFLAGRPDARSLGEGYFQSKFATQHPLIRKKVIPHLYLNYDGGFYAGSTPESTLVASPKDFADLSQPQPGQDFSLVLDWLNLGSATAEKAGAFREAALNAGEVSSKLKDQSVPVEGKTPEDLAMFLSSLMKTDLLGSATVSFDRLFQLDTHSDHYREHQLEGACEYVSNAMGALELALEGTDLWQNVCVVLVSEFCRTPKLNRAEGKDHNTATNSLVVIGGPQAKGCFGASGYRSSEETHGALPISPLTGRRDPTGLILTPSVVLAALAKNFGVNLDPGLPDLPFLRP